jgi:hypothetical protein
MQAPDTAYAVVINHLGETARLACHSLEEAQMVRQSFVNWGGFGYDIEIVTDA